MKKSAPYGTWPSSISTDMVANGSPKRFDTWIDQNNPNCLYWCESIAEEKGRTAIMMHDVKEHQCVLPRPLNVKSKVHEYGGSAYTVFNNNVFFVLADDQRVYQAQLAQANFEPRALTPDDGRRYADLVYDEQNNQLIAVCEEHTKETVKNYLVAIDINTDKHSVTTLAQGHDFYSSPRISPDGLHILWLTWNHPNMPWDHTDLWLADIQKSAVENVRSINDRSIGQSICQPNWSPEGDIVYVSDLNNWWNLYQIKKDALTYTDRTHAVAKPILEEEAEFCTPPWVFGMANYGFLNPHTIFASYSENGSWKLCLIDLSNKNSLTHITTDLSVIHSVHCWQGQAIFVGASANKANAVYLYSSNSNEITRLSELESPVPQEEYALPKPIQFPTTNNDTAYALFYSPHNANYENNRERPPLIVICHGGPTAATETSLNFKIQYWTNRGFAVADVNYRGSTGYGREYRHKLNRQWGLVDVDDVCAVVDYLDDQKLVDKNRCVIKGSSAGGYTVLAALAFRDTFCAGVDIYGIGDLETLATDTHKFEARYLDKLVGNYPEEKALYRARSPIHAVDKISCPLLIFQGLEDKVVPPQQADNVYEAVKKKGMPVAYVRYPDEAHGFRRAETISHMLDSELQFYANIFGFDYLGDQPKLNIENLDP
ncbi:MAG: prolyl oligopeptidase family serine peptidase [Agarilytica sp.]